MEHRPWQEPGPSARRQRRSWREALTSDVGAVVLLVVGLMWSVIIWNQLSGDQLQLEKPGRTASARANTQPGPTRPVRHEFVSAAPRPATVRSRSVGASAGPSTISGTAAAVALIVGLQGTLMLVIRALRRRRVGSTRIALENARAEKEGASLDRHDEPKIEGVVPQPPECAADDHGAALELDEDRTDDTAEPRTAAGPPSAPLPAVGNEPPVQQRASQPDPVAVSTKVVLFDRRLGQRVAFVSPARLRWLTHDVVCTTGNLSMRGLRCVLPGGVLPQSLPATGSAVLVTLTLDGTLVDLRARVGWCRAEDIGTAAGLEFMKLRGTDEALLQRVVIAGTPV